MASARNARPSDSDTSSGTRNRRSFALVLSVTVMATARAKQLGGPRGHGHQERHERHVASQADRQEEVGEQRQVQQFLQRTGPLDQGEIRARVLEHHRLVDHRELEVRGGVVDRDAAGLGDHDDEQSREGEQVGGAERDAGSQLGPHERPEAERSAGQRHGEEPQHEGGLGQRGDRHVPARAHAAEGAAGVEGGQREREPSERQAPHQQQHAAGGLERRRRHEHRDQRRGREGGGEVDPRRRRRTPTTPCRRARSPCGGASPGRSSPAGAAGLAGAADGPSAS